MSRNMEVTLARTIYNTNLMKSGEPAGIRTLDILIKSEALYQLSYRLPCQTKF